MLFKGFVFLGSRQNVAKVISYCKKVQEDRGKYAHSSLVYKKGNTCIGRIFQFPFNPVALRKAKIVYNFGLSCC